MTTYDEQSRIERELRAALSERAREVRPSPRLDAILREASAPPPVARRSRWLVGLAVAAAAAVVAGTVWASRPDSPATLPGGPPSTSSTPSEAASPSPSPTSASTPSASTSTSPDPTPSATGPTGPVAGGTTSLGIYTVGTNGGTANRPGLVRVFWTAPLGGDAPESDRAGLAVVESIRTSEQPALWAGTALDRLEVDRNRITIVLTGPGRAASDARTAELAISSLVWTAQAAVGRGDLPVTVQSGSPGLLLGFVDPSRTFTRAGTPADALCDIWLDSPTPGASVDVARAVVVRGQAVAFEANVEWELRSGDRVVRKGFTTASIGAPGRGTFTVDLGRLDAGSWTFRALTSSAKDGSPLAERVVGFVVR
ncbi:hypothetical protein GCM10022415_30920 [Knoellia locipacati]|uniref:Bacterial spore germination immunoglobulin-like domain-containing protein n=1 Tax=Knoellia locipacati TaxID=882824 RepID=A0A512T3Y0_9MICO|nr:Gmad2 immunoglobulin-like domain-containing protein [Knoellia locipacati]GEQ14904.1 hypothetical protein KLO01_29510 [Knoellia locipacati]